MDKAFRPVIDADAHVLETLKTWEYLDPKDRGFRPQLVRLEGGREQWVVNGKMAGLRPETLTEQELRKRSAELHRDLVVPTAAFGLDDVALRCRHMDEVGIDVQVLHNSIWINPVTDRLDIQSALSRSYNRWMADIWAEGKGRLRWTCIVPTLDAKEARRQMRFSKEHGAVGVCVRPFETDVIVIDEEYYPIFAAADELDLTVTVHIANGSETLHNLLNGRSKRRLGGFITLGLPTVESCWALIVSDLPKTFPNLRWAFVEATAGWIPWVSRGLLRRAEDLPPDPFSAFNIFVTTVADDDHGHILEYVSDDVLLLGTDYGHNDYSGQVDAMTVLANDDRLSTETRRKILSANPMRAFGITEAELAPVLALSGV